MLRKVIPALLLAMAPLAQAQDAWPTKPLNMIAPFPPAQSARV